MADEVYERAKLLNDRIKEVYTGRDLKATIWSEHVSPDMQDDEEGEDVVVEKSMGRPLTAAIAEFIVDNRKKRKFHTLEEKIKYITGTPGCGKSVSLGDAVSFLLAETANALEQRDAAPELKDRRMMLLSGDRFVADACTTLYEGLVLAYVNDPVAVAELKLLPWTDWSQLYSFLSRKKKKNVYIVVDDGDALDEQPGLSSAVNDRRATAFLRVLELVGVANVVLCASIGSNLRLTLKKSDAAYKLVAGGFSIPELHSFLAFFQNDTRENDPIDYTRTGRVPRLLRACLDGKAELDRWNRWHEEALFRYISRSGEASLSSLHAAAAGGHISELSDVLDSRCFYRGSGGRAECLTMHLRNRAVGWAMQKFSDLRRESTVKQIRRLMDVATLQQTTPAVGITAEAAALLVIRLQEPVILQHRVAPEATKYFRGKLTRSKMDKLKGSFKRVLYIPLAFNHTGVDVYYQDEDCVIVFQITVASDPIESHPHTRGTAEALFQGDERAKIIAWVVVTGAEDVQVTSSERGYAEVFVPFGKLDTLLETIDTVVKKIRSTPEKTCPECCKIVNGAQVECTRCETWYHLACVEEENVEGNSSCLDCRVAYGDGASDEDYVDEFRTY